LAVPVLEGNAITNETSNTTSSTVTLPASVAADDIIILCIACDGGPTGFASSGGISMIERGRAPEGSVTMAFLLGRAAGSETTQDITWTGSQQLRVMALRISGIDNSIALADLIDVLGATSSGAGTTATPVSSASTVVDTLFISMVAVDRDRVDSGDTVSGTGWTEVGVSGSSGGANGAGLIVGELDQASIGTPADAAFGTWASDGFVSRTINIISIAPVVTELVFSRPINQSVMI